MNFKILLIFFVVSGFFCVGLGAFGSHILKNKLSSDLMNIFEISNKYQFYHTLVGLFVVLFSKSEKNKWLYISGLFFMLGLIFFSGSLYVLVFTEIRKFGAITPIGGVAFMIGWIFLGIGVIKSKL